MSMEIDNMEILRQANETHIIGASPLRRGVGSYSAQSRLQAIGRRNRSLGQIGTVMSGNGDDGLLKSGGPLRGTDTFSSIDRFGVQEAEPALSMSIHVHPHTAFLGNFSPNSSIPSHRHAGDSSIDTSTDSVSNSATTLSAVQSQASSISVDDFLSSGAICEAARDDPKVRQEKLAARFGIERSTVSKTFKKKGKWLVIQDEGQSAFIMKQRTGKFPDLERRVAEWINDEVGKETPVLDMIIRHRALEVAKEIGIGADQFKASLGWVEKFRERHKLPKPAMPPDFGDSSDQICAEDERKREETFRSGFRLATAQQGQHPSHFQDPQLANQMERDAGLFYSPPPSQTNALSNAFTLQRLRSTSTEKNINAVQETPKASKRHYDDMAHHRGVSPIDATMARVHLPTQNLINPHVQGEQSNNGVHQHDDSRYAIASSSSSSSSSAGIGATKRRRGAAASAELSRGGSGSGSANDATSEGSIQMNMIRGQLRRTKSGHVQLLMLYRSKRIILSLLQLLQLYKSFIVMSMRELCLSKGCNKNKCNPKEESNLITQMDLHRKYDDASFTTGRIKPKDQSS
ncbi:CenpB-DNA-bind-domain-containing protein [Meira miltonrushii]|uniref:CenpB-DNA-bind-domain-containing protein n=1 Tax=Meira miltonrushii TaxID=1280837 RepID=A0A316V0Z8_9BASI|nr:CenpB-DNA-bind-domain-containing protein [Meira miltonrushii]PWN31227.1 CenpB-DNA-bind-domain-containing protein [Meira miltonrushii]